MSVCWLALWLGLCLACPLSQLPRQEVCPLRLVKFMTFKFHSLSLSHFPSLLMSALRFACYSRRNFRAHTYGKYLKVFALFWVFIAPLSLSFCPSRSLNAYRNKVNDYVGH